MLLSRPSVTKLTVLAAVSFVFALATGAQDVVTVGSVAAAGSTADVPIYIRDTSGTPLGIDQPAGSKIQSFSIKVDYAPASAVQSVTINRDGITAGLTPTSEFKPSSPGSISILSTFQESTNPIPFTLNAASPGNLVAHLVFTLSPSATPGTSITLSLDSSLTQLTDQGGTAATNTTEAHGPLALADGSVRPPAPPLAAPPPTPPLPLGGGDVLTVRTSANVPSNTAIGLSSSKPEVSAVPPSVVIPSGQKSITVPVSGLALGDTTITATLGSSTATAEISVTDCPTPAVPVVTAPAEANVATTYTVSWPAVARATEYRIDESISADFQGATSQTLTGTSASYSPNTPGPRSHHPVRAPHPASVSRLKPSRGSSTVAKTCTGVSRRAQL